MELSAGRTIKKGVELDRFSSADLRSWSRKAKLLHGYHVRLYYHLEALRSPKQNEIRKALWEPSTASIEPTGWGRIVDLRYSLFPLSAAGSVKHGGRFNIGADLDESKFPPFPALYMAEDYDTAYGEKFGKTSGLLEPHELKLRTPGSFLYTKLNGQIENLFDLRDPASVEPLTKIVKSFRLTTELRQLAKELHIRPPWTITKPEQTLDGLLDSHWQHYPKQYGIPANPQIFGRMLEDAGFHGVVYPSSKGNSSCIALFLRNFESSSSYIEIADDYPAEIKVGRLDCDSWRELSS